MLVHPVSVPVQFATVPSIRWNDLQAPCVSKADIYAGHLPDGSSVQIHSADADFALYGLVMVAHYAPSTGRMIWTATQYGRSIVSGHHYAGVLAAGRALIVGA